MNFLSFSPGLAEHAERAELKFLRSGTAGCAGASARPAGPRILRTFASSVAEARHRREHLPPSVADLVFGARVLLPEGQQVSISTSQYGSA